MAAPTTSTQVSERHADAISPLQGDAWAAWNASYHAPVSDAYRVMSHALYQQDVHERIESLFARSDAQNAELDALLKRRPTRSRAAA